MFKIMICLILVTVLCSGIPLVAQVDRASLAGTVTDPSGGVVPDAKLELISQETGLRRDAVSSGTGTYTFSLVPIGTYSLAVSSTGFKTTTMKDLRLGVGDNRTLNVTLEVTAAAVEVTVEDVLAPLEKSSAVVGTVIGGQQITRHPGKRPPLGEPDGARAGRDQHR